MSEAEKEFIKQQTLQDLAVEIRELEFQIARNPSNERARERLADLKKKSAKLAGPKVPFESGG